MRLLVRLALFGLALVAVFARGDEGEAFLPDLTGLQDSTGLEGESDRMFCGPEPSGSGAADAACAVAVALLMTGAIGFGIVSSLGEKRRPRRHAAIARARRE